MEIVHIMVHYGSMVLLLLVFVLDAGAQRPERYGAEAVWVAPADGKDEGGAVSLYQLEAKGSHPLYRTAQDRVSLGVSVKRTDFSAEDTAVWPDITVYDLSLPLQYQHTIHSNLNWSVTLAPGLSTDFEQVTMEAFQWTALGLATWQSSPAWRWVGGLYYGQAFGESRVFPALGALWKATPEWNVNLIMPRPGVTYAPVKTWTFTARVQPSGGDWSIEQDGAERDLILETWKAGLEARWKPNPGMALDLEAGWAFARSLEMRQDDVQVAEDGLDTVPYVRIGFQLY